MSPDLKRYNRNTSLSLIQIPLGVSKYVKNNNGTPAKVYFIERKGYGVHVVAAITRYGKSLLVRNLLTQIGQHRPVIILDYLGEHGNARYPNFLSEDKNGLCLPNMKIIKGFKFRISQFNMARDWVSLNFSGRAPLLMQELAREKKAHLDDPQRFWEMLEDVPTDKDKGTTLAFFNRWGFHLVKQNPMTMDSIKQLFEHLLKDKFFAEKGDYVHNFGQELLRNSHLDINFGLDVADINKARALAGKVLEQLESVIERFPVPPLIVVEEADVLAPNAAQEIVPMSSVYFLVKFVLKLQKKGIELMFIVQDPKNLHPDIFGNRHTFIYGHLPANPNGQGSERGNGLVWNHDKNYREFIVERKGQPGYETFIPEDSCTIY